MKPIGPNDESEVCPWCGHCIIVDSNDKDPSNPPDELRIWVGCSNHDDCPVQPRTYDCATEEEADEAWDRCRAKAPAAGDGMDAVTLLLKADGSIASIYASKEVAEAKAAQYNAEPFIDGEPDADAPYTTRTWGLFDRRIEATAGNGRR